MSTLDATSRTIDINGRAGSVLRLVDSSGRSGLTLEPDRRFQLDLLNELDVETIVHWHGHIPPNAQDGVSNTNRMIASDETQSLDFDPRPGTFRMHSHVPAQEIDLLAAPLIITSAEDVAADWQEVVLFLHDFSFSSGEEVLAKITFGQAMHHGEVRDGSHAS